jgi:hypothetical protein
MSAQRRSNWTPVIVSNGDLRNESDTQVSLANDAIAGPAFTAPYVTYVDGSLENTTVLNQRQADLRFAIGVALALVLPAVIGLGVFAAAESIILIAG